MEITSRKEITLKYVNNLKKKKRLTKVRRSLSHETSDKSKQERIRNTRDMVNRNRTSNTYRRPRGKTERKRCQKWSHKKSPLLKKKKRKKENDLKKEKKTMRHVWWKWLPQEGRLRGENLQSAKWREFMKLQGESRRFPKNKTQTDDAFLNISSTLWEVTVMAECLCPPQLHTLKP